MAHNVSDTKQLGKRVLKVALSALLVVIWATEAQIETALAATLLTQDFDTLGNCSTGREDQCWIDNGFATGNAATFDSGTIKSDGGATGSGYFRIQHPDGGTSTSRITIDITDSTTVAWGMWVRFSNDYMFYSETHGPGVRITGTASCDMGGNWEPGNNPHYYVFNNGSCGVSDTNQHIGVEQTAQTTLKGGHWYWVSQEIVIDTSCSDSTAIDGCNGSYKLWIDGTLRSSQTNLNFAGVNRTAKASVFAWEWYFHNGWVALNDSPQYVDFDSLTINDVGGEITAPGGVTQGTASTTSYFIGCYRNNGISRQYNDCLTSGPFVNRGGACPYGDTFKNSSYITQATSSPIGHDGYPPDATECSTEAAATDAYLKIATASGDGAGIAIARDGFGEFYNGAGALAWYQYWCIHGWMYLPSGNDYSNNPLLAGFRAYSGAANDTRALAITVNNSSGSKWAIGHRWDSGTTSVLTTSATAIVEDQWNEFQICYDNTAETVSLYVDQTDNATSDGSYVVNAYDISGVSHAIMQDPGDDGGASAVVGVIDYDGTGTFTVGYDDYSIGTASFIDTNGWTEGDSPFGGGGGGGGGTDTAQGFCAGVLF